jgi:uncharacterized membrane protein
MKDYALKERSKYSSIFVLLIFFILFLPLTESSTLEGTIYNSQLDPEPDVILEINNQKFLSKEGSYSFTVPSGDYILTARKGNIEIKEDISIKETDQKVVRDLFLISSLEDESELWNLSDEDLIKEEDEGSSSSVWKYVLAGIFFALAFARIIYYRKKYGPLNIFRRKIKEESKKTVEEAKADLDKEPQLIDQALDIIRKHDGRISQKDLRKEMLYLSEAKVSLIVTELEHRNRIEKVKKGRGNIILLK